MDLNFNNLSTDSNGRLRFSGISSGIDTQNLVDSIITARRISAVSIEDKISVNETRTTAFNELQTLSKDFAEKLDVLRNPTSFLKTDIFDSKQAFTEARVKSSAPAGHVASQANAVLGVNITGEATNGTHVVEVVQLARAHQVRSDAISSKTDALAGAGFPTGDMEINGKTITVGASDSLLDLRDKINNTTDIGVNASVVSVSDSEHYLVLASKETGVANQISFGNATQANHNAFGFTASGTDTVKNEIQQAQNSIVRVDNLGVDIERATNTVDDVLEGVTLNLFKAEENTEIVVNVEPNLNEVKTAISDFVNSYNELKKFIDDQGQERVRSDESGASAKFGPLYGDNTVRQIGQELSSILTSTVAGLPSGSASLGQVGIDVNQEYLLEIDNQELDDNLLQNLEGIQKLFGLDVQTSDPRLTVSDVGDAQTRVDANGNVLPYYVNIGGTDADGKPTSATLSTTAGQSGANNGSVTVEGNKLTATSNTGAEGMSMFYFGEANGGAVSDVEVTFTRGVADRLFSFFDDISKTGGLIDSAKTDITTQNENLREDVVRIDQRLELQRETLTNQFLAMESAMLRLRSLQQQLTQQTNALNGGNDS